MKFFKRSLKMLIVLSLFMFPFSSTFAQHQSTIPGTGPAGGIVNHCADGIKDNGETGVDCGDGKDCKPCPTDLTPSNPVKPSVKPSIISIINVFFRLRPSIIWPYPYPTVQLNCDPTADDSSSGNSSPTAVPGLPCTVDPTTGTITATYSDGHSDSLSSFCSGEGKIVSPQCNENVFSEYITTCDPGLVCSQGKCIPENGAGACSQGYTNLATGGSLEPGMTLTVTTSDGWTETFGGNDYCDFASSDVVMKVICDANENHISYEAAHCTHGTVCINGSCQQPLQPTCKENGDRTVSVTDDRGWRHTNHVYCDDDKTLEVPFCNGDKGDYKPQTCPAGKVCRDGVCRLPPCSKT